MFRAEGPGIPRLPVYFATSAPLAALSRLFTPETESTVATDTLDHPEHKKLRALGPASFRDACRSLAR